MARRSNPALIGAFVVGALALAILAVAALGSGRFFRSAETFALYFKGSVNGLAKGAPVKFRGVPIGVVTDIKLALPEKSGDPRIPVLIEIDNDRLTELGVSREVTGPETVKRLIVEGGLRAQLQQQSFITGLLYIGLDVHPDKPAEFVLPPDAPYPEIPTLPTVFEQAQAKIEVFLERLSTIDFEALGRSLTGAVEGIDRLVGSPELQKSIATLNEALTEVRDAAAALKSGVRPLTASVDGTTDDLRAALRRLEATLDGIDSLFDPRAPLVEGAARTLEDLGEAARAVRQLAERLDRDPSALLTGRKAP